MNSAQSAEPEPEPEPQPDSLIALEQQWQHNHNQEQEKKHSQRGSSGKRGERVSCRARNAVGGGVMTTSTRRRRGRLNLLNKHFSFAVELSKVIPGVSLPNLPLPVALPLSISLLLTLHPSLFYLACKLATWQLLNLQTALDECQIRCQARRSLYTLHRLCWV